MNLVYSTLHSATRGERCVKILLTCACTGCFKQLYTKVGVPTPTVEGTFSSVFLSSLCPLDNILHGCNLIFTGVCLFLSCIMIIISPWYKIMCTCICVTALVRNASPKLLSRVNKCSARITHRPLWLLETCSASTNRPIG